MATKLGKIMSSIVKYDCHVLHIQVSGCEEHCEELYANPKKVKAKHSALNPSGFLIVIFCVEVS